MICIISLFVKNHFRLVLFIITILSFSFAASTIKIKSPKGREKLKIGENYPIKWKTKKNIDQDEKVKLYFSSNGGDDWELIGITENDGEYNWDVIAINSKNCLIKVQNFDNSLQGISKKEFTIDGPFIKILTPSEKQVFSGGEKARIIWHSGNLGNELVNIYYSLDNGYNWTTMSDNTVDTGFYIWDAPHLHDVFHDCLIKITTNSDKAVQISKNFTIINQTNKIRIIYPNGGELIEASSSSTITWLANGLKANLFKILFSDNGGRSWKE